MDGSAAYWLGANTSFTSSRSSLDILRPPDESIDGSFRRSILDAFDFLNVVDGAGEGDREFELDSSITIVFAGRSSPVYLAEDEVRLREVDRDPESAARVSSPEELDESLTVEDEEN